MRTCGKWTPGKDGYILLTNSYLIEMKCFKCGSLRMIKFIDGFGNNRIFCRGCSGSFLDASFFNQEQTKLPDFDFAHYNRRAVIRHF